MENYLRPMGHGHPGPGKTITAIIPDTKAQIRSAFKTMLNNGAEAWSSWKEILKRNDKAVINDITSAYFLAEKRLQKYKNSYEFKIKIRAYCNLQYPNDCYPYEVVRVVNPKIVEVREMDVKQTVKPKDFTRGGFVGHFHDNHVQEYEYTSNPNNQIKRIHLGKKGWGNGYFLMSDKPFKFYDYNL